MKIFFFSDILSLKSEVELHFDIDSNAEDGIICYENTNDTMMEVLNHQRSKSRIFIFPPTTLEELNFYKQFDNVFFLTFRLKDMSLYDFKFNLHDIEIKHINIVFRCRDMNKDLECMQELCYLHGLVNADSYDIKYIDNNKSLYGVINSKNVTGTLLITQLKNNDSIDYSIDVIDSNGFKYSYKTPISYNISYYDIFGGSLSHILRKADSEWLSEQYKLLSDIMLKIKITK